MLCVEGKRTLICYAGSASEASIGSKPVGSELRSLICSVWAKSQDSLDSQESLFWSRTPQKFLQPSDKKGIFENRALLSGNQEGSR